LYLDSREGGTLSCEYDPEIGGAVIEAVWNGRILRYAIPCLTAEAADRLMVEVTPLATRVMAGYEEEVVGADSFGHLSDDAKAATDEIEERCWEDTGDLVQVAEAAEWLASKTDAKADDQLVRLLGDIIRTPQGEAVVRWALLQVEAVR
jgi:hypothetical protein